MDIVLFCTDIYRTVTQTIGYLLLVLTPLSFHPDFNLSIK